MVSKKVVMKALPSDYMKDSHWVGRTVGSTLDLKATRLDEMKVSMMEMREEDYWEHFEVASREM